MATIRKVQRQSGVAYKAIIKKNGVQLKSKTFDRKGDAVTWAKRIEADTEAMEAFGSRGAAMSFDGLVDEYMRQWIGKDQSQATRAGYWSDIFRGQRLVDISPDLIRQQLKDFEAGKCRRGNGRGKSATVNRGRAPATVNRLRSCLSAVFRYAIYEGYVTVNPVAKVPSRRVDNARTRFLNEAERERLLLACRRSTWDRLYLLVLLAMTSGMRKSEMLGLRWCDVDFEKGLAFLGDTKNGEQRYNPVPAFVLDELRGFRQVGTGLIFASEKLPTQPMEYKKHWSKALIDAGIAGFRFHDLRHTCASLLAMSGATLHEIGAVLGHKSTQTTLRYSHLSTAHKSNLVERVMLGAIPRAALERTK